MMAKGFLIVFEGIDGSGKTSQASRLQTLMTSMGHEVVMTEEPQKPIAEKKESKEDSKQETKEETLGAWVRTQLLHQSKKKWDNWTMVYMLMAARVDHIKNLILPAIADGKIVICDRFSYSTLAYQGYGAGMADDVAMIKKISTPIDAMIKPAAVFLIDITPTAAMVRLESDGKEKDMMETQPIEFFEKVRSGFLQLAKERDEIKIIDGMESKDAIAATIKNHIEKLLKQ